MLNSNSLTEIEIRTSVKEELKDITDLIEEKLQNEWQEVKDGVLYLYVPHTTCAVFINEHDDPSVAADILNFLQNLVPTNFPYRHLEGNSPAHIKASVIGNTLHLFIEEGKLALGTWQGIFLAEFDGPRRRKIWLKLLV